MARGRSKHDWEHTAHLMATALNVARDPKTKPIDPIGDIYPYAIKGRKPKGEKIERADLKALFQKAVGN